ncbi:hypothetical protein VE02_10295 [Pseudogymnoascus sp. 03VT05]|nr:hypothetical protein VE02_10295 [Pseudogymnoascus sp. 03VT05]
MTLLTPPRALAAAFRQICMRCVRRAAKLEDGVPAHNCVWSSKSSKCEYCVKQKALCVLLAWFLKEEYQTIVDLKSANPKDPAAIKAAYEEAVHGWALVSAIKGLTTAVVGLKEDTGKLLAEQTRAASLLGAVDKSTVIVGKEVNFVAGAVAKVEKAVGKLAGAVAAVPRTGEKRKRGQGDEEEGNGGSSAIR